MTDIKALVVDDDPMILMGLQMILEMWGMSVQTAEGMADALDCLGEATPSVVISDLRLRADVSGFEVVDRVRELTDEALPAIILTGEVGAGDLAEGQRRGAVLLQKPVQPDPLRKAIEQVLGRA